MRIIIFLAFVLMASIDSLSQSVVDNVVRKSYVDSVAAVLRSEIKNNGGGQPSLPDCEHSLDLVSVYNVDQTSLYYNFYSVGVTKLIETVYNPAGKQVYQHTTDQVTQDRIKVPHRLSPGSYSLIISNANCKAVSKQVSFVVPGSNGGGTTDPPTNPSVGFNNKGVYSKKINDVLYEWIPSQNVRLDVSNGYITLYSPESKKSFDGKNNCKRFILGDLYDNELPESEVSALTGNGIKLPPGNYAFRILYVNASSMDDIRKNMWTKLGMGSGTSLSNSAEMELVYLSITDGKPVNGIPSDLLRTSWLPHYQLLPYDLKLPTNKGFGTTRIIPSVGWDTLFTKFTHLQARYVAIPYGTNRLWNNVQAYDHSGNLVQPDWVINNATIDRSFITLAELAENYGNLEGDCPNCYSKSEQSFKGIYGRYQREKGVTSPNQTRLYDDYFSSMYGYGLEVNSDKSDVLRKGLSNRDFAKKRYTDDRWTSSGYFANGAYDYRNFRLSGYIGNLFNTLPGTKFYDNIYELEKVNLAVSDRNILKNGWQNGEAVGLDQVTQSGAWLRLKLDGGDIIRVEPNTWPLQTMMVESFYHLLLGNDYILWHSSVQMNTDPETFTQSWYGGFDEWKTKWNPYGSDVVVQYNPDTPGHPKQKKSKDGSIFPENTLTGETGAFIGSWLYSQISYVSDRVSKSIKYCNFTVNGTKYTTSSGSNGDKSLSSRISQNAGQDWIVTASEKKLPICICTEGQNGKSVIFQDPNAGLTKSQFVEVDGKSFLITGNRLNVFKYE